MNATKQGGRTYVRFTNLKSGGHMALLDAEDCAVEIKRLQECLKASKHQTVARFLNGHEVTVNGSTFTAFSYNDEPGEIAAVPRK